MPSLPALAQLADHLLADAGGLAEFIEAHRNDGLSWDRVARELWLATEHRIDTTGPTVQKWHESLNESVA